MPPKYGRVGEHRQRRRATCFVGLGGRRRVEVGREIAFRRRTPLDLADHREGAVGPAQATGEIARSAGAASACSRNRSRVCGWCSTVTSSIFVARISSRMVKGR